MKNRFVLAAAGIMAAAVFSTPATAALSCDATSLSGVYGFNRVGVLTDSPLRAYSFGIGPFRVSIFASVGQFTADGAGHLTSIIQTISVNGVVYRNDQAIGQYTINSDCTGTLTIRSSLLPTSVNYDFVFEADNTVLRFVGADQSTEVIGKAIFEGPVAACTTATLAGAFGAQVFGIFFNSVAGGLFIDTAVARFLFDGAGNLSYSHATIDNNLSVFRWASSNGGKDIVNANCTGSMSIPGTLFPNVDYVLVANNNALLFMNTDNTLSASIGEMTRQ